MEDQTDWDDLLREVDGTPVQEVARHLTPPVSRPRALRWLERTNLSALVLINQLLQSTFVALLVMAFLVVFGVIVLPAEVQERWIGESVSTLLRFELLGEERRLSGQLLTVSAMLSGIVGLYFTGAGDHRGRRCLPWRRLPSRSGGGAPAARGACGVPGRPPGRCRRDGSCRPTA